MLSALTLFLSAVLSLVFMFSSLSVLAAHCTTYVSYVGRVWALDCALSAIGLYTMFLLSVLPVFVCFLK